MRGTVITILTLFISSLAVGQEGPRSMSLEECIVYALENNEQLKIAKLENDIAETQVRGACKWFAANKWICWNNKELYCTGDAYP